MASAGIGRSTTTRTAGERGWSCVPSRSSRPSSRCATAGAHVILLDPAGERLTDALARELASLPHLALVCGRYEGIDERVRTLVDREVEHRRLRAHRRRAAGARADRRRRAAPARGHPGGLARGRLVRRRGCSSTRSTPAPKSFRDLPVPPVLLSGHHGEVDRWRRREALRRTLERRAGSARDGDADRRGPARSSTSCEAGTVEGDALGPPCRSSAVAGILPGVAAAERGRVRVSHIDQPRVRPR